MRFSRATLQMSANKSKKNLNQLEFVELKVDTEED